MKSSYTAVIYAAAGLPPPTAEYRFAPPRKWRFDFAWPEQKVALEIEGGVWIQGRHTRGSGYVKDMEKYSVASVLGWCVIRTCPLKLHSYQTISMLKIALEARSYPASDAVILEKIHAALSATPAWQNIKETGES